MKLSQVMLWHIENKNWKGFGIGTTIHPIRESFIKHQIKKLNQARLITGEIANPSGAGI